MKKWIIGIVVIAVIAVMVIVNLNKTEEPSTTANPQVPRNAASVKAMTIETGSIASYVTAPGYVEEVNSAQVFFDTPLRVSRLLVDKNDSVQQGDRLVELDSSSLTDEMDRLTVQKEIQSITLKKMSSGQDLLSVENSLTSSKNAYEQAQEYYQTTSDEYEKQKKLYESGAIAKTQVDQYERTMKDARTAMDNAKRSLDSADKTYQSYVGSHDLDIQAQIKNIQLLSTQIADINKKLEKIANLEKAPITGFVTEIYLTEGGYTVSGQPAFTIIDTEHLQIHASVNEYNTKNIAVDQKVTITGDAFGDDIEIQGKVVSVAPLATSMQTSSGYQTVVEIVIEPIDGKGILKPGLNVDCDIITQEKDKVVLADFSIFMNDKDNKQYALRINEETMALEKRYVTLGIYSNMEAEVIDGLQAGDKVVVDPQPSLDDGDRIKITE